MAQTVKERVVSYLLRCKHPKTQRQIVQGAHVNANTLRRLLSVDEDSAGLVVSWADGTATPVDRSKNSDGVWQYALAEFE